MNDLLNVILFLNQEYYLCDIRLFCLQLQLYDKLVMLDTLLSQLKEKSAIPQNWIIWQ